MRTCTPEEIAVWSTWIGHSVVKRKGKPFKSGEKVGTVAQMTTNEPHTSQPAFLMAEDGSTVECFRCRLHTPSLVVDERG